MPEHSPARRRGRASNPDAVRMEDVARAAGVAPITVSRALSSPEKVSAKTLAAIRAAIEQLQYVPNLTAGSLASSRSRTVAIIVPTISNSLFSETVNGLAQTLASQQYQLLLGQTHYRTDEEASLVQTFLGRRVDGMVLTGVNHGRGVRSSLLRARIPVVETWDLTERPIHMVVGFSNYAAGAEAAHYLASRGYRSLAYIGANADRSIARLHGFRDGARAAGLGDVMAASVPAPSDPADAGAALAELAERGLPRALFCSDDMIAAGALFECARRRIAVPGQLAIMGFADLPIAASIEPALTTIQVQSTAMGRRAGEMLLSHLQTGTLQPRVENLGFSVVQRASA